MNIIITSKKINSVNFKLFGDVISTKNKKFKKINNKYASRFNDLAKINVLKNYGSVNFSIFKVKPRLFPMQIKMLEKHPLSTQTFFPLGKSGFIVVVAKPSKIPLASEIKSFIVPPNTGINYKVGVWHYPMICTTASDFIVIDRKGSGKNLEIFNFKKEVITLKYE